MLHAQTTSECKQDPLVEKMTTVSRIPPVVLTARFAASSPTTRTLASWWSTTTSLAGNSGQEVWLSPPLCLQHHHLLHEAVSVRNGEENSGWNSIIPPDVQTDGEVLQDQGLQLGEDGLEDFLLEFFFSELIVVISAYFEFMSNLSNSLKTKTRSETSRCECACASRESSELYWHMRMLKCDMSDWLSDEPPKMLKLLFATKNLRRTIFRLWMRLSIRWASTRTLRDLVVQ